MGNEASVFLVQDVGRLRDDMKHSPVPREWWKVTNSPLSALGKVNPRQSFGSSDGSLDQHLWIFIWPVAVKGW